METTHGTHHILYRRIKGKNQLVIDNYLYDEVEMRIVETAHSLSAVVDGHRYEVGMTAGSKSYIRIDGQTVKTKLRLY